MGTLNQKQRNEAVKGLYKKYKVKYDLWAIKSKYDVGKITKFKYYQLNSISPKQYQL